MDVSQLVGEDKPIQTRRAHPSIEGRDHGQTYSPVQYKGIYDAREHSNSYISRSPQRPAMIIGSAQSASPYAASPALPKKQVTFELLLTELPQQRARLPIRVYIYPHDATDSIITTVKNFFGLYDGNGLSFEDKEGCTLIARYENFQDGMTVYVRVNEGVGSDAGTPRTSMSPIRPRTLGPAFEMAPPSHNQGHPISRPVSRTAHHRSVSPYSRGRRSVSVSTLPKSRSRPNIRGRTGSAQASFADHNGDLAQDMSDSDGGNASVTSSRRGKADILASAEISVDNIVEGGRRKRARFDSSELPLFVPSQVPMPASISSVSPQRRIISNSAASPYQYTNQQTFSYTHTMASPQSHSHSDMYMSNGGYSANATPQAYNNRALRQRQATYAPQRYSAGSGILPTPDPTIGSVISDEDVALQLMRLGDASNFSTHGRTSTSTLDDAMSGKAEVSGESDEGSDIDEDHSHHHHAGYASDEYSGEEYEDRQDISFKGESDGILPEDMAHMRRATSKAKSTTSGKGRATSVSHKVSKSGKMKVKVKGDQGVKGPISPTSLPTQSRKASNASLTFGPDEDDLSTKPRCQRCRKSKKGCDRQRPCGRCKDAGIGIDGCVSEDEGNGRKGRYGRHMGVPVKKDELLAVDILPSPVTTYQTSMAPPPFVGMNNKKRKR